MGKFVVAALLLVLGLAWTAEATSDKDNEWVGTYTDSRYGGVLSICIRSGDLLYGSYSHVGILVGKTEKNGKASGSFYEVGAGVRYCAYGSFDLELAKDGSGFTGTIECGDNAKDKREWAESVLFDEEPHAADCAVLRPTGSAEGRWEATDGSAGWRVCVHPGASGGGAASDLFYESSLDLLPSHSKAYEQGYAFEEDGLVLSGYFIFQDGTQGPSLAFKREDGRLGQFWVDTNDPAYLSDVSAYQTDDFQGGYRVFDLAGQATGGQCSANEQFIPGYFDPLGQWSSAASALSVSAFCAALLAGLFCFLAL